MDQGPRVLAGGGVFGIRAILSPKEAAKFGRAFLLAFSVAYCPTPIEPSQPVEAG